MKGGKENEEPRPETSILARRGPKEGRIAGTVNTDMDTSQKKRLTEKANLLESLVEQMGFEPTTYALRTHRSPN